MRNQRKDEIEMAARREAMICAGFRLFSQNGIDTVSMQDIAKECHLGIATLYRYYSTKMELVLDIGTRKWEDYIGFVHSSRKEHHADEMTAAGEFAFYLDFYIDLYQNHRDLLRFNQSMNNYVQHERATPEQLKPYTDAIGRIRQLFYSVYEKGRRDGTLRTDIPADSMFSATAHIMLAVIVRYAQGLLYSADSEPDLINECILLKQMILREYTV
ncbi:MAG: TetR/AcrR family transcriptional regulator [Clostridiales bacterium]|nr:TetR/AcrR family transcriptional regulator [Clostridiales bacterium]